MGEAALGSTCKRASHLPLHERRNAAANTTNRIADKITNSGHNKHSQHREPHRRSSEQYNRLAVVYVVTSRGPVILQLLGIVRLEQRPDRSLTWRWQA